MFNIDDISVLNTSADLAITSLSNGLPDTTPTTVVKVTR